jgi:hypothetical protein
LAALLFGGEVTTDVVVTDGVIMVGADVVAPAVIEAAPAIIEAAPAVIEAAPAVIETAPAALESVASSSIDAAASSSSSAWSTATLGTAAAALTLSGDGKTSSEEDPQRKCMEQNPFALPCEEQLGIEEKVIEFIMNNGYSYESLGNCYLAPVQKDDAARACNGGKGESWHCDVKPYADPIARVSKPGGIASIFSCLCCDLEGKTGVEWRGEHWSPGK